MPPITVMLKPASGLCNLRCKYCFYADEAACRAVPSYGLMTEETLRAVLERVLDYAHGSCTVAFQGGEPTLAGLPFFRRAVELGRALNKNGAALHWSLQTNGYLIDEEWARFFAEHHFLVGVSLDGPKELHDANRVDAQGKGTYSRVMRAVKLLENHGVDFNILTVVTDQSARRTQKLYNFFQKNGLPYQQYIPCLDPLGEAPGTRPWSLSAQGLERHLKAGFDCWYQDAVRGAAPYNRYFANLLDLMRGGTPEACDLCGVCSRQLVVEADGGVYPCDFYMLDEYRLGNLVTDTFDQLEARRTELGFVERSAALKEGCRECKWWGLCRGGCRRNWEPIPGEGPAINRFCEAYQSFFKYAYPRLLELSQAVRR